MSGDERAAEGAAEVWLGPIGDVVEQWPVVATSQRFEGRVWSVHSEDVSSGSGVVRRDVVRHLGAVAVVVLDSEDRILLIRQYRHPVGMLLAEIPAGLLDVAGEDPLITGQRELAEEAGLAASQWHVLVDFLNSPGGSSEALRIYLARGVSAIPGGRPLTGEAEEADLPQAWVPLDEAVGLVLGGNVQNAAAVCGILGAAAARAAGWQGLREPRAPWPARDHLVSSGRVYRVPIAWREGDQPRGSSQGEPGQTGSVT